MGLVLYGIESSHSKARSDAANEANVVDNLFETTEYLPNPARQAMPPGPGLQPPGGGPERNYRSYRGRL